MLLCLELAAGGCHSGYGPTSVSHQLEYLQYLCHTVPKPDDPLGPAAKWLGRVFSIGR